MTRSFRTTNTQQNLGFIWRFGAVRATLITLPCAGHTMTATFCMWRVLLRLNLFYCGRRHRQRTVCLFPRNQSEPFFILGFVPHAPFPLFQHWYARKKWCFFLSTLLLFPPRDNRDSLRGPWVIQKARRNRNARMRICNGFVTIACVRPHVAAMSDTLKK